MRSTPPSACLALFCILLSGCSGSTDPSTAHLFDNINNLHSGEYDRQIAQKDAEAAAIIRSNQQMQGSIDAMQAQTAANRGTIAALREQLSAARQDAAAARNNLGADPVRLGRLQGYEAQLAAVEGQASGGSDPAVLQAEVARIRASIRALSN